RERGCAVAPCTEGAGLCVLGMECAELNQTLPREPPSLRAAIHRKIGICDSADDGPCEVAVTPSHPPRASTYERDPSCKLGFFRRIHFARSVSVSRSLEFTNRTEGATLDVRCGREAWRGRGPGCALQGWRPSCAVVGNSGKLRHEIHGHEIDAADAVLRFNQGRTKGFEKQVGTKATFRMYNGPYASPKQKGEVTLTQLRDPATRTWVKAVEKERAKNPDARAYMFDPELLCHSWDWVDHHGDKPSSGLVGVLFALALCSKVDVYGYQPAGYFNHSEMPHYYDWERPKPGREKAHPFEQEQHIYQILESAAKIAIH
ncbi:hypothetical protein CYMTET_41078, partial [Cymbomonas tetramitiformis]